MDVWINLDEIFRIVFRWVADQIGFNNFNFIIMIIIRRFAIAAIQTLKFNAYSSKAGNRCLKMTVLEII